LIYEGEKVSDETGRGTLNRGDAYCRRE
jgi:hypothetical protein